MNAAKLAETNPNFGHLSASAQYLLGSPGAPAAAQERVAQMVVSGERPTVAGVRRIIQEESATQPAAPARLTIKHENRRASDKTAEAQSHIPENKASIVVEELDKLAMIATSNPTTMKLIVDKILAGNADQVAARKRALAMLTKVRSTLEGRFDGLRDPWMLRE